VKVVESHGKAICLADRCFKNGKKLQTSQKQALISVEIYTSTHFMLDNAGKCVK